MAETYGTSGPIGDQTTVRVGGTFAISAAFEISVGIVANMNTSAGTANSGEVVQVTSSADAETKFGADSELTQQLNNAILNGAGVLYGIGVTETSTTETFSSTSSGTLGNDTIIDPRVAPEHDITATDTTEGASVTVNLVDDTPTSPTDANTINLNPVSGEWSADESSSYDIDYTYGDYGTAIEKMVSQSPRFLGICTELTADGNTALTEMNTADTAFDFMHAVIGTEPNVDPSTYSQSFNDRRLGVVTPSRGYTDDAETNEQRTVGAVAGKQAGKALGDSTTQEPLRGFTSLKYPHSTGDFSNLIDAGTYPIVNDGGIRIYKDQNTSGETKLERFAWSEITDEVTEISHLISREYLGEKNTEDNREELAESHRTSYDEFVEDALLDAYAVSVSEVDSTTVDLDIGVQLVGYMDQIVTTITVGDVVTNGGVA